MKKIFLLVIALVLCAALLCSCGQKTETPAPEQGEIGTAASTQAGETETEDFGGAMFHPSSV